MLRRVPGRFLQPVLITVGAAVVNIACNVLDKRSKTVVLIYNDLHFNGGGVGQQTVPPGFIFFPWMNVRVVPKGYRFDPFGPERIDTAEGAGGAAGVHQNRCHNGNFPSEKACFL